MIWQQTEGWRWADRGESMLEMIATQLPDRFDIQLLRRLGDPGFNHGRLVIASRRASGLAKRTNRLHQLSHRDFLRS